MATKEELLQLAEEKLPDNVTYEIEPEHLREVLMEVVDAMGIEGQTGPSLDLGVKTIFIDPQHYNDYLVVDVMELMTGAAGEEGLKNGNVLTLEIRFTESYLMFLVTLECGQLLPVCAGEAALEKSLYLTVDQSFVYTITYIDGEEVGLSHLLINAATYNIS